MPITRGADLAARAGAAGSSAAVCAHRAASVGTGPRSSSVRMRWAASASCRACASLQRVEVEPVERRVDRADRLDARARGLDGILAEGELVEQDRLVPADLADLEEELERLDQVDRADGQVVVPLAPVVVDLDREEAAVLVHERQHVGGRLLGEQRVAEVDHDADVVAAGLLDAEQRARRGRPAEVRPRLLGLVLDRDADAVVHLGDGAHAVDARASTARGSRPGRGSRSRPGRARASRSARRAAWRRRRPPRRSRSARRRTSGSGLVNAPRTNSRV